MTTTRLLPNWARAAFSHAGGTSVTQASHWVSWPLLRKAAQTQPAS